MLDFEKENRCSDKICGHPGHLHHIHLFLLARSIEYIFSKVPFMCIFSIKEWQLVRRLDFFQRKFKFAISIVVKLGVLTR